MSAIKVSNGFRVEVESEYLAAESDPKANQFVFAYHIKITNEDAPAAKILSRRWIITDGWGRVQDLNGEGVVGKQPHIPLGETFEYSSFCPLPTTTGTMQGIYRMQRDDGAEFDVEVPLFFLFEPGRMN